MSPKISIIVPLSGGAAQALRCFEGIATQSDQPSHEIIVVDDASVGLEPLLARLQGDVQVVRSRPRSVGDQRLAPVRGVRRRRSIAPGPEQQRLAQHRLHRQRHLRLGRLDLEQPDHRGRRHRRLAQGPEHDPRLRHGQLWHPGGPEHRRAVARRPDHRAPALGLDLERRSEPALAVPAADRLISRPARSRARPPSPAQPPSPRPGTGCIPRPPPGAPGGTPARSRSRAGPAPA